MQEEIKKAIARICLKSSDGDTCTLGTGFLIKEKYLLTALHVVANRHSFPITPHAETFSVIFYHFRDNMRVINYETTAKLTQYYNHQSDWAILECDPVPPNIIQPLKLVDLYSSNSSSTASLSWKTYGFASMVKEEGMTYGGTITDLKGHHECVVAIQLSCTEISAATGVLVNGLSGSPCLVDGVVVGILRSQLVKEDEQNNGVTIAAGGTLWACPTKTVSEQCPSLTDIVTQYMPSAPRGFSQKPEHPCILIAYKSNSTIDLVSLQEIESLFKKYSLNVILKPFDSNHTDWRIKLIEYLGCCHGAIILITEEFFSDPMSFYTEIAILRWRNWVETTPFCLMCSSESIKKQFLEKQIFFQTNLSSPLHPWFTFSEDEIFCLCDVLKESENKPEYFINLKISNSVATKVQTKESDLKSLLSTLAEDSLDTLLNSINNKHTWDNPTLTKANVLARELMRQGLHTSQVFQRTITHLSTHTRKEMLGNIFDLLIPLWVDLRVAGLLAKAFLVKNYRRIFAINATTDFVGKSYIRQASFTKYEDLCWRIAVLTIENEPLEQLKTDIVTSLATALCIRFPLECQLEKKISFIKTKIEKQQTFILIQNSFSIHNELLDYLEKTYPKLVVILLVGFENNLASNKVEFLDSGLSAMDELELSSDYDSLRSYIYKLNLI